MKCYGCKKDKNPMFYSPAMQKRGKFAECMECIRKRNKRNFHGVWGGKPTGDKHPWSYPKKAVKVG